MKKENKANIVKKAVKVMAGRGFYFMLAMGLVLIVVTAYINNTRKELEDIGDFSMATTPVTRELEEWEAQSWQETPAPTPTATPRPSAKATAVERETPMPEPPTVPVDAQPLILMLPMQGELTAEFSGDELVYSKTMQDWRVHSGIDIRGDVGTQVQAAADGVVQSAAEDGMTGFTVVIDHGDGIQTVYANLQTNNVVKAGQVVQKGEVIGGVGKDAIFEIAEPPHLHFEVRQNNVSADPFHFMS